MSAIEHQFHHLLMHGHEYRGHPKPPGSRVFPGGRRIVPPERATSRPIPFSERLPRLTARLCQGQQRTVKLAQLLVDPFEAILTLRKPEVCPVRDKVSEYGSDHPDECDSFRPHHYTSKGLR